MLIVCLCRSVFSFRGQDRAAQAPVHPPAHSTMFGNGIPWSEVQVQLQLSVHKLDFLSCGTDRVSAVSFAGASLAYSNLNYHYIPLPVSCHVPKWAVTWSVGSGVCSPPVNPELWLSSATVSFEPPAVRFIPFLRRSDMLKTLQLMRWPSEPGGLCDVPAESFSKSHRNQLSAFRFLQLLSIPQCAE